MKSKLIGSVKLNVAKVFSTHPVRPPKIGAAAKSLQAEDTIVEHDVLRIDAVGGGGLNGVTRG